MFKALRQWVGVDMAIDLGTANTIIHVLRQGIVLNEPSVVAVDMRSNPPHIIEVGHGAKQMLGRAPGNISVIRPMKDGVIADYRITEQMLNYFIKKVHGSKMFTPGPRVVICIPTSSTPVDKRAIRESVLAAGATKVYLIEEPMAAALGCDLPVHEPVGSMVLDIGGGTAEIGVISLGGMVYSYSLPVGGNKIDTAIIEYVRQNFGIAIGESTAERIKKHIAVAHMSCYEKDKKEVRVSGQKISEGVPRHFTLGAKHVYEAIEPCIAEIVKAVRVALENVPPELSADISDRGMALTGGGALIDGLDIRIREETGVPVNLAEDPLTCVARGCGISLQYLNEKQMAIFS
ncbi:MAG: rod shape-determining protein [Gammaproteobacteria bacterium WSBS_2016_MAG_OTU1]